MSNGKIKFRYRIKQPNGNVHIYYFTLKDIEKGIACNISLNSGCVILSRDRYTGQRDKNDREIYEKDICKAKLVGSFTAEITYDRGSFKFNTKNRDIQNRPYILLEQWCQEDNKAVEIVGDMYNNPELAEVKNEK